MPGIKLTDVTKAASLLEKVVDRADVMRDGGLSSLEFKNPATPNMPSP